MRMRMNECKLMKIHGRLKIKKGKRNIPLEGYSNVIHHKSKIINRK